MSSASILPAGSVVKLESVDAPVMVIGYEPVAEGASADYLGVMYPVGLVTDQSAIAFDRTSITEVLYLGFLDDEGRRAFATVRTYRQTAQDMAQQVEEFVSSLTPERVRELYDHYAPVEMPDEFEIPEGFEDVTIE